MDQPKGSPPQDMQASLWRKKNYKRRSHPQPLYIQLSLNKKLSFTKALSLERSPKLLKQPLSAAWQSAWSSYSCSPSAPLQSLLLPLLAGVAKVPLNSPRHPSLCFTIGPFKALKPFLDRRTTSNWTSDASRLFDQHHKSPQPLDRTRSSSIKFKSCPQAI